jgi:hypothetical protein
MSGSGSSTSPANSSAPGRSPAAPGPGPDGLRTLVAFGNLYGLVIGTASAIIAWVAAPTGWWTLLGASGVVITFFGFWLTRNGRTGWAFVAASLGPTSTVIGLLAALGWIGPGGAARAPHPAATSSPAPTGGSPAPTVTSSAPPVTSSTRVSTRARVSLTLEPRSDDDPFTVTAAVRQPPSAGHVYWLVMRVSEEGRDWIYGQARIAGSTRSTTLQIPDEADLKIRRTVLVWDTPSSVDQRLTRQQELPVVDRDPLPVEFCPDCDAATGLRVTP